MQYNKLMCEYGNCNNDGRFYPMPEVLKVGDDWDDEPVYLCDLHYAELKDSENPNHPTTNDN